MRVKRINDVTEQLFDLHKNNTSNLLSTGFKTLDDYYQVGASNTTII
jgi:hypothetical protein